MFSTNQDSIRKLLATLDPKASPVTIMVVDDGGIPLKSLQRILSNISDEDSRKIKASGSEELTGSGDRLKLSSSGELTNSGENKLTTSGSSENVQEKEKEKAKLKLEIVYASDVYDAFEKCGAVISREEFEKLKPQETTNVERKAFLAKVVADTKANDTPIRSFDIVILDDQMPVIIGSLACQTFVDLGISNANNTFSWSTTYANDNPYPGSNLKLKKNPVDKEEFINPQGPFYKLIEAAVKEKNEKVATQGKSLDDMEIQDRPSVPTIGQKSE